MNYTNDSLMYEPHFPSLSRVFSVTISIYLMLITVGGLVLNVLLIHTVRMHAILHTTDNYFIINLAVGDLLRAITVLPFESDFLLHGVFHQGIYVCGLKEIVFLLSLPSAMINLLLLTTGRLLMLTFPFEHKVMATEGKVVIVLLISWTYFFIVAFIPLMYDADAIEIIGGICLIQFPHGYLYYQLVVNFVIPLICVLIMSYMIFKIAAGSFESKELEGSIKKKRTSNQKAAKTVMIMVINVSMCWGIYILLVIINVLFGLPLELLWVGCALNYTSIATNPLLYGLFNTTLKKILIRTLSKFHIRKYFIKGTTQFSENDTDMEDSRLFNENGRQMSSQL